MRAARHLKLSPEQVGEAMLQLENWTDFRGYGPLPGIREARFRVRTPDVVGTEIAVTNTDGSGHVEQITEWLGPDIVMRFDEPTRPIQDGEAPVRAPRVDPLVMPIGASIPLGAAFYLLFRLVTGGVLADPLFIGFGLGYLAYDGTHYAVHHFRMSSPWGRWIKRYHMIHHHTGVDARYGVSSPLWDWVFGTAGDPKAE